MIKMFSIKPVYDSYCPENPCQKSINYQIQKFHIEVNHNRMILWMTVFALLFYLHLNFTPHIFPSVNLVEMVLN